MADILSEIIKALGLETEKASAEQNIMDAGKASTEPNIMDNEKASAEQNITDGGKASAEPNIMAPKEVSTKPTIMDSVADNIAMEPVPYHQYIIFLGEEEPLDAAVSAVADMALQIGEASSIPSFTKGDVLFLIVNSPYSKEKEMIKSIVAEVGKGGALVMTIIATDEPYKTFLTPEYGHAVWLYNSQNQLINELEDIKPTYNDQWAALMDIMGLTNSLCREPGLINLCFEDLCCCIGEGRRLVMAKSKGRLDSNREVSHRTEQLRSLGKECCKALGTYAAHGKNCLIHLYGGNKTSLFDLNEAVETMAEEMPEECNIIFGAGLDMENDEDFLEIKLLLDVE